MCSDDKRIRFLPLTLIFTVRLFKYNTKFVYAMQIDVYIYNNTINKQPKPIPEFQ